MSKLNVKSNPVATSSMILADSEKGVSGNGNIQTLKGDRQQVLEAITSMIYGRDTFYEGSDARMERFKTNMKSVMQSKGGVVFIKNVLMFTRKQLFMRTMPIVGAVEMARVARELNIEINDFRGFLSAMISRADEITDMYAYALKVFGSKNKVPLAIKRACGDAMNKFDAYQLAKYNRDNSVKLADIVKISHVKPVDIAHAKAFKDLMDGTLAPADTWETLLSTEGQKHKNEQRSKSDLWADMVTRTGSGSMGYMALLRNLRNIQDAFESDAPKVNTQMMEQLSKLKGLAPEIKNGVDVMDVVVSRLTNEREVLNSKQLPMAFVKAYESLTSTKLKGAVEQAADIALGNLPILGERVVVILDVSGSMTGQPVETGAIFASALFKANAGEGRKCDVILFSDNASKVKGISSDMSVMKIRDKIVSSIYGGGTNIESAFKVMKTLSYKPDVVIVISDMEVNPIASTRGGYYSYGLGVHENVAPDALKIAINMNGGQTTPMPDRAGWHQLSGWSENIFRWADLRRGGWSLLEQFSKYES